MHESPTNGHSSLKPTLARVATSFYWLRWTWDVKIFLQQCVTCQRNKYLQKKIQRLLQPLPTPTQVWEDLSMNFITHLPSSAGHTVVWVICDRLTKYAHFLALPTHFTVQQLAKRFTMEIFHVHGMPKTIVSGRDPIFVSTILRQLFKAQGTNRWANRGFKQRARSIPAMFHWGPPPHMVPIPPPRGVIAQYDASLDYWHLPLTCVIRSFTSHHPRGVTYFSRRHHHPGTATPTYLSIACSQT